MRSDERNRVILKNSCRIKGVEVSGSSHRIVTEQNLCYMVPDMRERVQKIANSDAVLC
jgi:hypothetical protein